MPKQPQFPPYKGRISWSAKDHRWVIRVRTADDGGIVSHEFFQAPVLMHHLRSHGAPDVLAANEANGYRCYVFRRSGDTRDISSIGGKLIAVLRTHYAQFRGRPVKWAFDS